MKVLRVLLVDDSALIRHLIRSLVAPYIDIRIIGEAENGHDAVRMTTTYRPDVVLMDVVMPGMNGIDAAQAVQSIPGVRVLMLSLCGDEESVVRALRAGAIGYLLRNCRKSIRRPSDEPSAVSSQCTSSLRYWRASVHSLCLIAGIGSTRRMFARPPSAA